MKEQDVLEAIRLELEDVAFKRAQAAGLVTIRGQVCLNMKIKQQIHSAQIVDADWGRLMSLDIGPYGRKFIKALLDSKNQPLRLFDYFPSGDWGTLNAFLKRVRSYGAPLYISVDRSTVGCVKKRMLKTRG